MSFAAAARRELGKAYITAQVGFAILFYTVAERTGRTYEAVANQYATRFTDAVTAWVMSLPTWLGFVVVLAPLSAVLFIRLRVLMDILDGAIREHGLVRTIVVGGIVAIALAVVAEERPDLLAAAVGVEP